MSYYAIENIIFAICIIVSIVCLVKNKPLAIALILNTASGFVLPEIGLNDYRPFAFLFAGAVCLITVRDGKLAILESKGNEINHAVSYLYSMRTVCELSSLMGYTGVELTWLVSMGLLLMQLMLAFGGLIGYGKRINNYLAWCRSRLYAVIFQ